MTDNDLIRRGDARRVMLAYASSYSAEQAVTAMKAIPAAHPSPDVAALVDAVSAEIEARNLFLATSPDRGGSHGPKGQRKMALENAQLSTAFALARVKGGE